MNKIKLLATAALLPLMLAGCNNNTSSSSPTPTPESSDPASSSESTPASSEPGVSSTYIHDIVYSSVGVHMYGNALVADEEGVSYSIASGLRKTFTLQITKNNATEDLVVESNHIVMPAGSKFSITLTDESYYFFDDDSSSTAATGVHYTNLEFIAATAPASLGLSEGVSGSASGVQVLLSFTGTVRSFTFEPTETVQLSKITICYGKRSL